MKETNDSCAINMMDNSAVGSCYKLSFAIVDATDDIKNKLDIH